MSEEYADVQESYERCSHAEDFFGTFYDIFLGKTEEIAEKFAATDFKKQKLLLKASLVMMIRLGTGDAKAGPVLARVGESHSRARLDIRPDLYEVWLDSLCEAVKKEDPVYSPELEAQWRHCMRKGIDLITSMY